MTHSPTSPTATEFTGHCLCGAIRFRVEGVLKDSSICHCRMCQKAFGAYYAPLVSTRGADLTWTRGRPKTFRSSNFVLRGFCENCGTPLTYRHPGGRFGALFCDGHAALLGDTRQEHWDASQ